MLAGIHLTRGGPNTRIHVVRCAIQRVMTPNAPSGRILVVDDEPLVCDSVKAMLVFCGHQVETATTAQDALALLEKSAFDLVIVDYTMPKMKGDQLAELIKSRNATQRIAMITASAAMLKASGNPLTGVDLLISKPFQLDELRAAVAKLLKKTGAGT